jgi:hypothetical protein
LIDRFVAALHNRSKCETNNKLKSSCHFLQFEGKLERGEVLLQKLARAKKVMCTQFINVGKKYSHFFFSQNPWQTGPLAGKGAARLLEK